MPLSAKLLANLFNCNWAISSKFCLLNGLNTTTESNRLTNSGRKMPACKIWFCSSFFKVSCGLPSATIWRIISAPALLVVIIIQFLKSTFRPKPSVIQPSSKTCKNKFKILGWAFSNSSNSTKEKGLSLTGVVKRPGSVSEPRNLLTSSTFWNSDISKRIMRSSEPK